MEIFIFHLTVFIAIIPFQKLIKEQSVVRNLYIDAWQGLPVPFSRSLEVYPIINFKVLRSSNSPRKQLFPIKLLSSILFSFNKFQITI